MWLTEVKNASLGFFFFPQASKVFWKRFAGDAFDQVGATVSTGCGSTERRLAWITYSELQTLGYRVGLACVYLSGHHSKLLLRYADITCCFCAKVVAPLQHQPIICERHNKIHMENWHLRYNL